MGKGKKLACLNDAGMALCYDPEMPGVVRHDWYLREWLDAVGKKQADIVNDLGWNKAKVSLSVACKPQYNRDAVNELADYLNIKPYELLMHPEDAMAMRRLRLDAIRIAVDQGATLQPEEDPVAERGNLRLASNH